MKENDAMLLRYLLVLLLLLTSCATSPAPAPLTAADTDGDGVVDALDRCPDTAAGSNIDVNGCPHDEDQDGVFDFLDQCLATPRGILVGSNGCPLDDDGDGVINEQDQCPDTAAATRVDARGCPVPVPPLLPETLELKVGFRTDDATIEGKNAAVIADGVAFIKAHPECRVKVAGHTDSVGTQVYNQSLSLQRAEAAREAISAQLAGAPLAIEVAGYGEEQPVADNSTQGGRLLNRRAVITITCLPVGD
jgi:OOP family OmpA-OmpF porin